MITITGPVGAGGKNLRQDVITIQKALNKVSPSLNGKLLLEEGPLTVRGCAPYQRRADLFDPTLLLDYAAMK